MYTNNILYSSYLTSQSNLKAAKNLGMQTIRTFVRLRFRSYVDYGLHSEVVIDKSKEALQELGELLGMDLLGQETAKL